MSITWDDETFDPEEEQEIALEPLPRCMDEAVYIHKVAQLPPPTEEQIVDFVAFVAGAKSWYKHLPACPPGAPMHFYLDPNAGRDRLRRWGHQVMYRDRTEYTEQFHYSWMTTEEYRRRFGYLAFCCSEVTRLFMTEMLENGSWKLDPNVMSPFIEGEPGTLSLVPETVLLTGGCLVSGIVHRRTDARLLWRRWGRGIDLSPENPGSATEASTSHWPRIAYLCEALALEAPAVAEYLRTRPLPLPPVLPDSYPADKEEAVRRVKALNGELDGLIQKQRDLEHRGMKVAIERMLDVVLRARGPGY